MQYFNSALEKEKELCLLLKDYSFEIHKKDDGEYRFLSDDDICLTVKDSRGNNSVYIDLSYEFTLTLGAFHSHYSCCEQEYNEMKSDLLGYLNGKTCDASVYCRENGGLKWRGSCIIAAEFAVAKRAKANFDWLYKDPNFRNTIKKCGGEIHYSFFNPDKNLIFELK